LGEKCFGERKYFLLCVAGLIFFSLLSCRPAIKKPVDRKIANPLIIERIIIEKANCLQLNVLESLARHDDFEALLKQTEEKLTTLQKSIPADELLFTLGLLHAHPENPKKNYKRSLSFFRRVLNEYPSSICIIEAKIWAGVLDDIERAAKVDLEIEQKKKELSK
jgi:hypothetical protein